MDKAVGKLVKVGKVLAVAAAVSVISRAIIQRLYKLHKIHCHRGQGIRPVKPIVQRSFTADELQEYDGVRKSDVYVSVKGVVYEVAPQFYGPGQPYHIYAGREISRCLAKSDLTGDEINKDWRPGSTEEELQQLEGWVKKFESRYPVVGWFIWD
ncbi:cytochrome b5-like Heme/Steroid binding domain containing protein, putative [Trypanosoma equiperdum]|uniref:Cytochrome b5-like Heme/Steroid binding domain containing protein, putative n=1 Tax=Trypanosoma equiperdum TaxID=5694 RepID=A0A1G4I815_TRYEQ|nr:cytochrome b5-like Heme/Steroid binding domain containing protein, putative [Trypanosoma equiperdum]